MSVGKGWRVVVNDTSLLLACFALEKEKDLDEEGRGWRV